MQLPGYLTCHLRNLNAGQEATVRTSHGTMDWFKVGKGVPCLFNLYAEYIMWNAGLEEAQAGIKIAGRTSNNLTYTDDTTLMAESEEELKSLLMKVERGEWKSWLKTQHSKNKDHDFRSHHFMANRWETMGTVTDFIFLCSKITADNDCSHELKRHLLL